MELFNEEFKQRKSLKKSLEMYLKKMMRFLDQQSLRQGV